MQKNNIKSFVCSFLFSILAVYAVQKVLSHTPKSTQNDQIDIDKPEKISLFSDNQSLSQTDALLLASVQTPAVDVSQIGDLTAPDPVDQEIVVSSSEPDTVLQNDLQVQEAKPAVTADAQTDLALASEIKLSPEDAEEIKIKNELDNTEVVYADISDTLENNSNQDSFVVAEQNTSEDIPLTQNAQALHQKIDIAQASQHKIAAVEASTLINNMEEPDVFEEEKTLAEADIKKDELSDMFAISQNAPEINESAWETAVAATPDSASDETSYDNDEEKDSPWVVAIGNKFAKNQAAVETFSNQDVTKQVEQEAETQDESLEEAQTDISNEVVEQTFVEPLLKERNTDTKLAYQMIQNILIPIPEDILNDTDLTPDLTASPEGGDKDPTHVRTKNMKKTNKADLNEDEKESGLFKSIASWFGRNKNEDDEATSLEVNKKLEKNKETKQSLTGAIKDKVYSALGNIDDYRQTDGNTIMPAELRLSFQPNRAEISGQTLKWIYAFADNARDNDDVYIEVRIDGTSSYALQQKRLNLLSNIFSSRGVDYRKINTIFTSREPNSFIIRNIRFNNKEKGETNE